MPSDSRQLLYWLEWQQPLINTRQKVCASCKHKLNGFQRFFRNSSRKIATLFSQLLLRSCKIGIGQRAIPGQSKSGGSSIASTLLKRYSMEVVGAQTPSSLTTSTPVVSETRNSPEQVQLATDIQLQHQLQRVQVVKDFELSKPWDTAN